MCVYYATGNMVGVQKLYEAVRSVDIDKDKKRLEVGDYVKIIGDDSSVVAIVEERLENGGYVEAAKFGQETQDAVPTG